MSLVAIKSGARRAALKRAARSSKMRGTVDPVARCANNASVIRPVARAVALFLIAPFLTVASTLAPQHVHEANRDRGHTVVHSHFGPHEAAVHRGNATEIDHDAEHVVWLDSPI